jgi:hypothetical protein
MVHFVKETETQMKSWRDYIAPPVLQRLALHTDFKSILAVLLHRMQKLQIQASAGREKPPVTPVAKNPIAVNAPIAQPEFQRTPSPFHELPEKIHLPVTVLSRVSRDQGMADGAKETRIQQILFALKKLSQIKGLSLLHPHFLENEISGNQRSPNADFRENSAGARFQRENEVQRIPGRIGRGLDYFLPETGLRPEVALALQGLEKMNPVSLNRRGIKGLPLFQIQHRASLLEKLCSGALKEKAPEIATLALLHMDDQTHGISLGTSGADCPILLRVARHHNLVEALTMIESGDASKVASQPVRIEWRVADLEESPGAGFHWLPKLRRGNRVIPLETQFLDKGSPLFSFIREKGKRAQKTQGQRETNCTLL